MNARPGSPLERAVVTIAGALLARGVEDGALPLLFAATAAQARTGVFLGPGRRRTDRRVHFTPLWKPADDTAPAARLWHLSEEVTGVPYGPAVAAGPERADRL